ncbi:NAD(P)H-dependent oxidoreductase [uncultured Croceitalea sp.]|uniref:NADPH-dependent FMN reductase n=1 Tax=uncultured Croceitalea sp. TaxID=1798908 RepID=UPI0033066AA8
MAKILAFAGSNSSTSINYKLVKFTVSELDNHQVQLINMANFPFPMYSSDFETEHGYSNSLVELMKDINNAQGLILSVNEHNGNPSAYFKNVLDWLSRINRNFLDGTKVFLMATSPGKGGAKHALEVVSKMLPRFGAEIITDYSLPSFLENFDDGIINSELKEKHQTALQAFLTSL